MNKNEFYKQLLQEYTVDTEKIKCNAKRAARRGSISHKASWLGVAGAAVVVLGIGSVSLASMLKGDGAVVVPKANPEVAIARMEAVEANLVALQQEEQSARRVMYVSFAEPLSYHEMTMALSAVCDPGEITYELAYTVGGKRIPAAEAAGTEPEKIISGVKITAPASLYKSIQEIKAVYLVELAENVSSDESFEPLCNIGGEINVTTSPDSSQPVIQIDIPDATTENSEETSSQTEENTSTEETTDSSDITDETSTETENTEVSSEENTSGSGSTTTLLLPGQNTLAVQFISSNGLIQLGAGSIQLVKISDDGSSCTPDITYYAESPKISWKNSSGTQLLITACDGRGYRNKLYYADGAAHTLTELDISAITTEGELTGLYCNEKENLVVFRVTGLDKASVYTAVRSGGTMTIKPAVSFYGPLTVLSYSKGVLYYAVTDSVAGETRLYSKADDSAEGQIIGSFRSDVRFTRSPTLDAFAVSGTDAEGNAVSAIYRGKEAVNVSATGEIRFSDLNSSVFRDDNGCYCLTAAGVVPISESEAAVYTAVETGSYTYSYEISEDGTASVIRK